jgi:hypothetical protein
MKSSEDYRCGDEYRARMPKQAIGMIVAFCLVMAGCVAVMGMLCNAYGQEWHAANQATVAWDAVTLLANGNPVPPGDVIDYKIYLANAVTDPDKATPALIQEGIAETQYTITLNAEGKYFVGFQAARKVEGVEVGVSGITWSDDPEEAPIPFGLLYYAPPADVTGLSVP